MRFRGRLIERRCCDAWKSPQALPVAVGASTHGWLIVGTWRFLIVMRFLGSKFAGANDPRSLVSYLWIVVSLVISPFLCFFQECFYEVF
jgi:hypothetical protein